MTRAKTDAREVDAFADRLFHDASAAMAAILAALGDRLGLFKDLAEEGPATSAELAERTGYNERSVREWLAAMASAGYLRYKPEARRFSIPAGHVPALAAENGPAFLGGLLQMLPALVGELDRVTEAFSGGGGARPSDFGEGYWEGMERFSATWFEHLLVPVWIPAMPEVERKLAAGADVADVGCGRGRALIQLAKAYPRGRYDGFDAFGPAVALARKSAWAHGVAARVRFDWRDAAEGLAGEFDVITTFDVLDGAARPRTIVRRILEALKPGGIYVCVERSASEKLEDNTGPSATLFSGMSVLSSTTAALAEGGEPLGAPGLPESRLRALCAEAGFGAIRRVPIEDPIHALYEIRPKD